MITNLWLVRRRAIERGRSVLWVFFFVAQSIWAAQGPSPPAVPAEIDRLIAVAKVWATVKYFHPYLADRPIDWDKALLDALPRIRSARDAAEYKTAMDAMLSVLGDPLTRVLSADEKLNDPSEIAPQRTRIHYGLTPHTNGWRGFYSGVIDRSATPVSVLSQPLGEELTASIRLSEPIVKEAARGPSGVPPDRDFAEEPFPSAELRLLGAFRFWGAVHYFYAYKDLMDEDWDAAFSRLLPKFLSARDALEYNLAVSELAKTLADSHTTVQSSELKRYFGEAPVGLRLRLVDRKPVITDVLDEEAKRNGIHVGDLVTKVDGESLPERVRRQAGYISASTQQGLGVLVCSRILNGPEGSGATLTISNSGGSTKELLLKRNSAFLPSFSAQRAGDVVRVLPGKIGYLDMDRLENDAVSAAFDRATGYGRNHLRSSGPVSRERSTDRGSAHFQIQCNGGNRKRAGFVGARCASRGLRFLQCQLLLIDGDPRF